MSLFQKHYQTIGLKTDALFDNVHSIYRQIKTKTVFRTNGLTMSGIKKKYHRLRCFFVVFFLILRVQDVGYFEDGIDLLTISNLTYL